MQKKKLKDPVDVENARTKYSAALSLKNSEGEIQWNRYNAILLANTIIIGLFSFVLDNNLKLSFLLNIILWATPLFGIYLCFVWFRMTARGFMWTKFWMDKAHDIEDQIYGEINPVQEGKKVRDIIGQEYTKKASLSIIVIFILIYILIFINNVLILNSFLYTHPIFY